MPRIALTDEQKVQQLVIKQAEELDTELYKAHITKQAVADITGLSRQAVSHQFRERRLMPEVFAASKLLLDRVKAQM